MTTPTSQQDELRLRLFINNLPGLDSEAEAALWGKITEYVDCTVAERVLAARIDELKKVNKPELLEVLGMQYVLERLAELRAVVQKGVEQ